jgi:hypothetical protein
MRPLRLTETVRLTTPLTPSVRCSQVEQASEWTADTSEVRGIEFPCADPYRAPRVKDPEQEDRR